MDYHKLTIYIDKNELEKENIIEKNIKIIINDSKKFEENNSLIKIQNNKSLIIEIEDLKKRLNNIKNNGGLKKAVTILVPEKVEDEEEKNKKLSLKKTKTQNEINKNNNDNKNNDNDFFYKNGVKRIISSKFDIENRFNRLNLKINTKQSQTQQKKKAFNFDSKFLSLYSQNKKDESKFNNNLIENFTNDKIDEKSNLFKYIFFGESQCGKTMLITNFIHYIKNISYYSEKRYRLNLSELENIKEYKIKSNRVNFPSAILIDTPPLDKIKDNKNILDKINNYKDLNGIIYVLKNSDIKLHDNAKYYKNIFENISQKLGTKVYIMGTFCDAQKNLEYLRDEEIFKNIEICDIFYFNNSCLYKIDKNSKENWRRNYRNFNEFFISNEEEEEDNNNIIGNFFSNKNNKKTFKLENKNQNKNQNQNNINILDSLKENEEEEYDD